MNRVILKPTAAVKADLTWDELNELAIAFLQHVLPKLPHPLLEIPPIGQRTPGKQVVSPTACFPSGPLKIGVYTDTKDLIVRFS